LGETEVRVEWYGMLLRRTWHT